ncbi:MAG: alpha/beta fold hydrolase [Myxococcota bacterium]
MSAPGWVDHLLRWVLVSRGYTSRTVDTSVGPVHLLGRAGAGTLPPVLLVHGFGAAASQWAPLVRALQPHVRSVWAIDLPGHGFSRSTARGWSSHPRAALTLDTLRDGVIEALDRLHADEPDAGPAVVVGNSLGGAVALRYVHARPDRALGVHLLSPGGAPMTPDELAAVQAVFRVNTHREATAFLDRLYGRPNGWINHLMAPLVRRVFRDPALHGLLAQVTDADWLTPDEVRTVPRPIRVSWGKNDRILPSAAVAFWRAHLPPGAELAEPDDDGHVPQLAAPGRTASELLAFVRRCQRN